MTDVINLFIGQLNDTSLWEWTAVILALAYLLLAVKESIWCWYAAFASTSIYIFLFFDVNLFMESLLNVYYLIMSVYGWFQWRHRGIKKETKPIIVWSVKQHCLLLTCLTSLVFVSGIILKSYTAQEFAYIDSFTTWFAVLATYMVTRKVLENWLYWIVIDSVSIYLYLQKGFVLTAVLFTSYVVIAVFGWFKWKENYLAKNYE